MKDQALLPYYLEGRQAAQEEFEGEDFDAAAIAEEIPSIDRVHAHCMKVMEDHLRSGELEGDRRAWLDEHEDEISEDAVDPGDAYRAYCRGYIDESIPLLEAEVVTALEEMVEEGDDSDGDDESEGPSVTTLASWDVVGAWDAEQAFTPTDDMTDEVIDRAVASYREHPDQLHEIAAKAIDTFWGVIKEDSEEQFLANYSSEFAESRHDPKKAFKRWGDGWRGQAAKYLRDVIKDRARD